MGYWPLAFRPAQRIAFDAIARALTTVANEQATTDITDWEGNPRDYYGRNISFKANGLAIHLNQNAMASEDAVDAYGETIGISIWEPPPRTFADKLAVWDRAKEVFGALGCTDITLGGRPAQIVDDAVAAGELGIAKRLRAQIQATLVADAPTKTYVELRDTRVDDFDAILEAYVTPEKVLTVVFRDCGLTRLPAACARFSNLDRLTIGGDPITGAALRGVALPMLDGLEIEAAGIEALVRDDLVGFPNLTLLWMRGSPLKELDPAIIEVCPRLKRVVVTETPFATSNPLRDRWPNVVWE